MGTAVTPEDLQAVIESTAPLAVLDTRQSLEYVEGNIEQSTWVPRRDLEDRLPTLVPNRATRIVLCDNRGERAHLDAAWLESLGYEQVDVLDGGIDAWREAGLPLVEATDDVHATAFHYESKEFGERVEAARELPKLAPDELADRRDDVTVVDVRNPPEYDQFGTVPGSINVEGVDLALFADEVRNDEPLVVHCAGRTRSIIGTATLQALGFENVYELENGTMGWELAGHELGDGPGRPDTDIDPNRYARLQSRVEDLLADRPVDFRGPEAVDQLPGTVAEDQSIYVFDVRTAAEYEAGHLPGAINVAGGQLIQTAGRHIAVRDAEVVLVSNTHVRAGITAYWLDEMGFENVSVLEGGIEAWTDEERAIVTGSDPSGRQTEQPAQGHSTIAFANDTNADIAGECVTDAVDVISPVALADRLRNGDVTVVDLSEYDAYTDEHVPGAKWVPRTEFEGALGSELAPDDGSDGQTLVLTSEDGLVAKRTAAQLGTVGPSGADTSGTVDAIPFDDVLVLEGGLDAWTEAGHETERGTSGVLIEPRQAVRKPYAQGERAMKRYLEWEENLVEG